MDPLSLLNLGSLSLLSNSETRSISAENPTGERGGGAKTPVPDEETMAALMENMASTLPSDFRGHPSSISYWYQAEPHAPFPDMPPVHERWSR